MREPKPKKPKSQSHRTLSVQNLYDKQHRTYPFDGVWLDTIGTPSTNGAWIIWGPEKNGKTWLALMLANYFRRFDKVLYVSGEEGVGKEFTDACFRAKIQPGNNLNFSEYMSLEEINLYLKKRSSAKIIFIDNITVYSDELKNGGFRKLLLDHPKILFIFLAHEERGEPYTATAKLCRRLAKIIIHVQGLACEISGRCPGGNLAIDEEKAALYHGQNLKAI